MGQTVDHLRATNWLSDFYQSCLIFSAIVRGENLGKMSSQYGAAEESLQGAAGDIGSGYLASWVITGGEQTRERGV